MRTNINFIKSFLTHDWQSAVEIADQCGLTYQAVSGRLRRFATWGRCDIETKRTKVNSGYKNEFKLKERR